MCLHTLSRGNSHSSIVLTLVLRIELLKQTLVKFCSHWTYSSDEARLSNNVWLFLYCLSLQYGGEPARQRRREVSCYLDFVLLKLLSSLKWVKFRCTHIFVTFAASSMFFWGSKEADWHWQPALGDGWCLCLQSVCFQEACAMLWVVKE